jgi:hypothetical protein
MANIRQLTDELLKRRGEVSCTVWPNQWSNPEQLGPMRMLFTCVVLFTCQLEIELLVRDKIKLLLL